MPEELHDLPNTKKIVDDNIVYSSNSLEQHTALVKKFLTRCREAVIRLQRNICLTRSYFRCYST